MTDAPLVAGTRILVTGGSGFIGTNLVQHLLDAGCVVRSIDVEAPSHPEHGRHFERVDIREGSGLAGSVRDFAPEYLVHLAARTDLDTKATLADYDTNTTGVSNVLDAAAGCRSLRRVVIASSMLVCEFGYRPRDMTDYRPSTVYGQSKVETERLVLARSWPFEWTIVRPTSIWGPWFGAPYRAFFRYVLDGWFVIPGNRAGTATYGYVGNAVRQIERLLLAPSEQVHEQLFFLGDDPPLDLAAWAEHIARAAGSRTPRRVPYGLMVAAARVGDVLALAGLPAPLTTFRLGNMTTDNIVDLGKTAALMSEPSLTLDEGIRETLDWMGAH